jgi:hypothetical protein
MEVSKMEAKKVSYKTLIQRVRRDVEKQGDRLVIGRGATPEGFIVNGKTNGAQYLGNITNYAVANYLKSWEELDEA